MWSERAIRKALDWMVEQSGGRPIRASNDGGEASKLALKKYYEELADV